MNEIGLLEPEIGRIPSDWKIEKLKNLCIKIGSGATPRGGANIYVPSGVALIRSQNVYDDGFNKQGLAFINEDAAEKLKNVDVKEHDVLLNITGDSICRASIVPKEILPARVNQHVSILRTNEKLYYKFLFYYLSLNKTKNKLLSFDAGGTRQALTKGMLEEFHIPLPVYEEQVKMGDFFWTITEKIALNRSMNSTLEAIGQALFKHWFVELEFPNEEGKPYKSSGGEMVETELGEVPKGWRVGTLGDIANNPRRGIQPDDIEPHTPYIGLEHMPRKNIALADWDYADNIDSNKYLFNKGDILFGKLRPYFHKVGIAAVDGVCSTDILVIVPKQPIWYGMVLFHISSVELVDHADATSTGTRMPRTNWDDLARFQIMLPPNDIAQKFTENILPLIQKMQDNILQSRTLAALRDALLPKLMSGEIRVGMR